MEQGTNQPIGLYRHKEAGTYVGAIDETQANAFVHLGYELVADGRDAAMLSEDEIADKFSASQSSQLVDNKKGK